MTSIRTAKEVAAEAEAKFRECHQAIVSSKDVEAGKIDASKLFLVQTTLGRSIYFLEHKILELKREIKAREEQLKAGASISTGKQIKAIRSHIHALEQVIDYGKILGDSFAWIFVRDDEEQIRRHHAHERLRHSPVGVGGMGEIVFIASFQKMGEHLALHHGITSFLRIGDFSLVNLKTGAIEGIGELKTKKEADDRICVEVNLVGKKSAITMPRPSGVPIGEETTQATDNPVFAAKLDRQLKKMREAYHPKPRENPPKPIAVPSATLTFDPFSLEKLYDATTPKVASSIQLSPGLVLVGLKSPAASLTDHVFNDQPIDANSILANTATDLRRLKLADSTDNSVNMGWLVYPIHERYGLHFGCMPPMWWPIRQDVIDALLVRNFSVMTFFNPAFLIARFRQQGYRIHRVAKRGITLEAPQATGISLYFSHLEYFFDLAARHLITEDSIFTMIVASVEDMKKKDMPANARVSLLMSFRWN